MTSSRNIILQQLHCNYSMTVRKRAPNTAPALHKHLAQQVWEECRGPSQYLHISE